MTDWSKLKVVDLKAELKRRSLPYAGLKGELVARLVAADEEVAQQEEEDAEQDEKPQEQEPEPEQEPEQEPEPKQETEQVQKPEPQPEERSDEPAQPTAVEADNVEAVQPSLVRDRDPSPEEKADPDQEAKPEQPEEDRTASPAAAEPEPTVPVAENPSETPKGDAGQGGEAAAASRLPAGETPLERTASPTPQKPEQEHTEETSIEPTPEAQKRKRRSESPLPSEEEIARKRARSDNTTNGDSVRAADEANEADIDMTSADAPEIASPIVDKSDSDIKTITDSRNALLSPVTDIPPVEMDHERTVEPAVHSPTAALYISNLMRPLRHADIHDHLVSLAATSDSDIGKDAIVKFYLDQIRTHAFVVFDSESSASRVRTALHNSVWPNESNRKALSVDFIPPERVDEWIETEEASGRRSASRWQVVYRAGPDGSFEAVLESGVPSRTGQADPPAAAGPPPPRVDLDSANAIPIGPRSHRERERERERDRDRDRDRERGWDREMMPPPPTGPRGGRLGPGQGPGPRATPSPLDHVVERTHSRPPISYQMVSEDLARTRLDHMRSYYTRDRARDLGREINRYSFENGDSFVDRGKEIFEGIRPPHREGDRRGGGGGRGGRSQQRRGPPTFRPRSDRYLPGAGSSLGSSYRSGGGGRFRDADDDRLSRHDDSRDRDHRDRRHR